jgi:hypothetical protein
MRPVTTTEPQMHPAAKTAAALLLTILLAACGGGDHDEDVARTTDPVHCQQNPERCS